MAISKIAAPLMCVPLFQGLKPLQIAELGRNAERFTFRPGDVITKAGKPGDGAFLIVSPGASRVREETPLVPPDAIEPGSLVGELAMLIEHVYGATVVANNRVRALKITREAVHRQMTDDPDFARHLAELINARLSIVAEELRRIDAALAASFRAAS